MTAHRLPGTPLALLQLADSGCPTGGFAHSYGLEQLVRQGSAPDPAELVELLLSFVTGQLPGGDLAFVRWGWAYADPLDEPALVGLVRDRLATRTARPARDAETARGRALHRVLDEMVGARPAVDLAADSFTVLFGVAGRLVGADQDDTARAAAHSTVAGLVSAAVRLGRLGPYQAQGVLGRLRGPVEQAVAESATVAAGEWFSFAPEWELAAARSEHAGGGLFVT